MIKTIIFDLGGVIFFYDHMIACRKLSKFSNRSAEEIYSSIFHSALIKRYSKGMISAEEFSREVSRRNSIEIDFDRFKTMWSKIFWPNKPVWKLLERLKDGYKLLLLSNTDPIHFEAGIARHSIIRVFDDLVLSYRVKSVKPEKKIFLEAVKRSGCRPDEIVYIDDVREFADVAASLGMKAVHYKNIKQLIGDLRKIGVIGVNV
jgi:putative hydrolase of the HAD superfamily